MNKEQVNDPYQTSMNEAWEQSKAKYSLCNRCTKRPNCDDGKRNLYMNGCSRFVDIVDIPQVDRNLKPCSVCKYYTKAKEIHGYTPCGNCGIEHVNWESKSQADGKYINRIKAISNIEDDLCKDIESCDSCPFEDGYYCKVALWLNQLPSVNILTTDMIDDIKTEISMYENHDESADEMVQGIKSILSLIPNKVGHWIPKYKAEHPKEFVCDQCGYFVNIENTNLPFVDSPYDEYKFCPHCGCHMEIER